MLSKHNFYFKHEGGQMDENGHHNGPNGSYDSISSICVVWAAKNIFNIKKTSCIKFLYAIIYTLFTH